MPADKWTEIKAGNIDEAAERIIDFLEDTSKETTVIYFNGWYGVGASAILKVVDKRLRSSPEKLGLDKIIHVDCSLWQSKRALQKAIAQELELHSSVMAMFDQRDEEDDFEGLEQGARDVIPEVRTQVLEHLWTCGFLVIFHNGSGSYIDLSECGVPVIGLSGKRVLWTSQGRFCPSPVGNARNIAGLSDVAIYVLPTDHVGHDSEFMLHEEAKEVARYTGVPKPGISPEIVKECVMYYRVLRERVGSHGIDWGTYKANYWVCSGIVRSTADRSAWEIAQALDTNLRLGGYYLWNVSALQVPSDSLEASFFYTTGSRISLEVNMFQHSSTDRLRVIHLSRCTFSFSSPPFLHCTSLRFLLLDHCKDDHQKKNKNDSAGLTASDTTTRGPWFQKLWVLELSYTKWYWLLSAEALDKMIELRELNVKGVKHWSIRHQCVDHGGVESSSKPILLNLVKLQVTTDPTEDQHEPPHLQERVATTLIFPNLSSSSILKTIILEGCVELERLDPHVLPPSLESFIFSSSSNDNVDVSAKIESISFQGCTKLKSVLLRGLFQRLKQLDVSGTCIETLDLSAMRSVWPLKQLFLLGCEELRAILWPAIHASPFVEVLHIDTTSTKHGQAAGVAGSSSSPADFKWYISLRDGRLLRSLPDRSYPLYKYNAHVEISSPAGVVAAAIGYELGDIQGIMRKSRTVVIGGGEQPSLMTTISQQQQPATNSNKLYADVGTKVHHLQLQATICYDWTWPCKPREDICHYISLQDERMQSRSLPPFPDSICVRAASLHVHDSLSITSITGHSDPDEGSVIKNIDDQSNVPYFWYNLEWCRVERCPNIEGAVFTPPDSTYGIMGIFMNLKILWASQLPKARYIWNWGTNTTRFYWMQYDKSLNNLQFLHLDCCPRLIHVLTIRMQNLAFSWPRLETLEIVCCGDLREVFPLEDDDSVEEEVEFSSLRHIHLHELPMLRRICGNRRILAPKLETVKIRGCWSLTRLPAVGRDCNPKPKVDCEKEWWDNLQWDGMEAGHDPSLYEPPTHSRYYKYMTLPRGSVLR